jgi:hypothetical protein
LPKPAGIRARFHGNIRDFYLLFGLELVFTLLPGFTFFAFREVGSALPGGIKSRGNWLYMLDPAIFI